MIINAINLYVRARSLEWMKKHVGLFIVVFLSGMSPMFGQEEQKDSSIDFAIDRLYPYISMTKDELKEADSIGDLYRFYRANWVEEYLKVEIKGIVGGREKSVQTTSDQLSAAQKELMPQVDGGAPISVLIDYVPKNDLTQKEPKDFNFELIIEPEQDARFTGGDAILKQYIQSKLLSKIPLDKLDQQITGAVTFKISEEGEVIEPHLYWTTEDKALDALLMQSIQNMPCWIPAEYANGVKVPQAFALTIGNTESCVNNLLYIQRKKYK